MFLMKMKIDPTGGYHYPDEVLEYIRAIAPGGIKREIFSTISNCPPQILQTANVFSIFCSTSVEMIVKEL